MDRRACTGLLSLGTQAAIQVDSVPSGSATGVLVWTKHSLCEVDRILHSVIVAWKSHLYVLDAVRIERVFFDDFSP